MTFSSSLVLRPVRSTRSTTTHIARSAARAEGRAVVYAFGDDAEAPEASTSSTEGTVFYTDNNGKRVSGTETEYAAALASSQVYKASSITGVALGTETSGGEYDTVSLGDAMAFKGPGPELINGRCAMVAFLVRLPPWHVSARRTTGLARSSGEDGKVVKSRVATHPPTVVAQRPLVETKRPVDVDDRTPLKRRLSHQVLGLHCEPGRTVRC